MDIVKEKKKLRKEIRKRKKELGKEKLIELSLPVIEKLEKHILFEKAKTILLFYSMDDEVYTHGIVKKIVENKSKKIVLPCVKGDNLVLSELKSMDELVAGEQFGILEPTGDILENWNNIDLAIIPGVAFDVNGNRMGRGRGFYDKILNNLSCPKIGLTLPFQIVDYIPVDRHDVKLDDVIY